MKIDDIIEQAGGATKVARKIERDHSTVLRWHRVPAVHAMAVHELSKIPLHEIRPDVYPDPGPQPEAQAA